MKIKVKNKEQEINKENVTVSEVLQLNDVELPDMVSVQLNGEFVKREKFSETFLKENDELEFLYFMGGGSIVRGKFV